MSQLVKSKMLEAKQWLYKCFKNSENEGNLFLNEDEIFIKIRHGL